MKLHVQTDRGVTLIENMFIDRYMPGANGEYVKLYLYLLRCAGTGRELSISSIADFFDHTEKDVRRALSYWEKLQLLKLRYNEEGVITDIVFLDGSAAEDPADPEPAAETPRLTEAAQIPRLPEASEPELPDDEASRPLPAKRTLSAARKKALQEQEQVKQLIFVSSQYLARPLTSSEVSTLLYFYDVLKFSEDLIEYLVEYCAGKGNPGTRYMEKIAQDWYKKDIRTVEQARNDTLTYAESSATHREIFQLLGIASRHPAQAEIEYMDRWLHEWGFSMQIIAQACKRTILQTGQPSFMYADSILRSWFKQGVRTEKDIALLDEEHGKRKVQEKKKPSEAKTRFSNFPQREYDYDSLEGQLLEAQAKSEGTS